MLKLSGLRARDLLILLLCLGLSIISSAIYYHTLQNQSAKTVEDISLIYTTRAENTINTIFHKTDILAAVVKIQNGQINDETFKNIAQLVYTPNSGIRGIQYMPGAIVTNSYPVEGNEAVMGKNFLELLYQILQ